MKNLTFGSNKKHHIYIMRKSFAQGLKYRATIYAEHDYVKVNGSQVNEKFILSVHYNGDNSYLFINIVQQLKFKAINSLNLKNLLIIGNTSKQTDYEKAVINLLKSTDIKKTYDIHRYLMKKHDIAPI